MPSPLGIPEILCLITRYLTQQQLTTCVCVSQDWNLLFGGFVWRDLKVVPLKDPGTISLPWKTVERNLNDIEVLDFRSLEDCYPDRPYSDRVRVERADFERWDCPYLKSLSFRMDVYRTLGQPDPILRYPMLTHLDFGSVEYITGLHNGTIWSAAASCPLLQSLSVTKVDLVSRDWSHFYALWSRLRRLHLRKLGIHTRNIFVGNGLVISGAPETFFQGLGPSKLQELGLFDLHGLNGINGQLWFLSQCPELERFLWHHSSRIQGDRKSLGEHLATRTSDCPRLVHVSLNVSSRFYVATDDHLLPLLLAKRNFRSSLQPLQELILHGNVFGTQSDIELRTHAHASTLRILELKNLTRLTSYAAHRLLCQLPNLEAFSAPHLYNDDMQYESEYRPWVCTRLNRLWVGLAWRHNMVNSSSSYGLFRRLGMLTELRSLTVSRYAMHGEPHRGYYHVGSSPFGRALRSLDELTQLESFDLTDTKQAFTKEDVVWMADHWLSLRFVTGSLHFDADNDGLLRAILEDRGIRQQPDRPTPIRIC